MHGLEDKVVGSHRTCMTMLHGAEGPGAGQQDSMTLNLHGRAAQEAQRGAEGQVQGLHERIAALERQVTAQQVPPACFPCAIAAPFPVAL